MYMNEILKYLKRQDSHSSQLQIKKYQQLILPLYLQETRTTVAGGEWVSENLLKLCRILSSAAFLLVAVM